MASSSSSHQTNEEQNAFSVIEPHGIRRKVDESSRLFDVFINHRGPDVKKTVAWRLYSSLKELGIHAFLDSEEKELGDSFPSTIENAIHSAKVHIAIFSKGYAESPWCLAELVFMLQSRAKIIPLFYGVQPSALRFVEKGEYAKAFSKYEKKRRYMERLEEWKEALHSVSFLTGHVISSNFNVSESQNIVSAVQKEIQRTKSLHVAKYPVGLHKLVRDFQRLCLDQLVEDFERQCRTNERCKEKAQIVGIFGMGGVGKTTLAKELFNRKRSEYTQACFLFDVREAYSNKGFPSLQMKLLKDLYQIDNLNFHCIEEGTSHIESCIRRSQQLSFLIVLDNIDHLDQIDALCIMDILNQNMLKSFRSLVIVTTRDVGVLTSAGITAAYNLKGMDRGDARELFCWHAFGQPHSVKEYQKLVDSFLNICGGLPLSLKVIGSHVRGRDANYWRLELNKICKAMPRDIHQRLKISFDALEYEEQQIFMDIACFFVDKFKNIAMGVWEASGCNAHYALETLKGKCLVQEIEERSVWARVGEERSVFRMHDCLRDLGREMANGLSRPRRFWTSQDLKDMESKRFSYILAQTKGRCFDSFIDKSMNCRITYFMGESDISDTDAVTTFLLWLQLEYYGFRNHPSILSWIPLQNLRCLIIRNLWAKTLWLSHLEGPTKSKDLQIYDTSLGEYSGMSSSLENKISDLKKLIELNISMCQDLQELNVGHFSCLEKLILHNCCSLKTVAGISDLRKLVELNISRCPGMEQFRLAGLNSLKCITVDHFFKPKCFELDNCRNLKTIPGNLNLEKLVTTTIRDCTELEVLPSLKGTNSLKTVTIDGCVKLKRLLVSQCQNLESVTGKLGLTCLEKINIDSCGKLNYLQFSICQNLKQVSISDCSELEELPCFARQTFLEEISIDRCDKLQKITLPIKLVELTVNCCRELKTVTLNCDHNECVQLQELSSVAQLRCLKRITINWCDKFQTIQGFDEVHALQILRLVYCPDLEALPWSGSQTCLKEICIEGDVKLQTLQGIGELHTLEAIMLINCPKLEVLSWSASQTCLRQIWIEGIGNLQTLQGIGELRALESIYLFDCPELEVLSWSASQTCLKQICIRGVKKLQKIYGIEELHALVSIDLFNCPKLEELPFSARQTRLKKISIFQCYKLQSITLPRQLVELRIEGCKELKSVTANCDHGECMGPKKLSNVVRWSCLKRITVHLCEKLHTMEVLDELRALESMQLSYCSNAVIGKCIPVLKMLKCLPSKFLLVVGRAVGGEFSTLDPLLFCGTGVRYDGGIDFSESLASRAGMAIICAEVSSSNAVGVNDIYEDWVWNLDSNTELDFYEDPRPKDPDFIEDETPPRSRYNVPQGEWIITIVITDPRMICSRRNERIRHILTGPGRTYKRGWKVIVEKGAEWKTLHLLHKIVGRIYPK